MWYWRIIFIILTLSKASASRLSMQVERPEGLLQIASPAGRALTSSSPPSTPTHSHAPTHSQPSSQQPSVSQSEYNTSKHTQTQGSYHSKCMQKSCTVMCSPLIVLNFILLRLYKLYMFVRQFICMILSVKDSDMKSVSCCVKSVYYISATTWTGTSTASYTPTGPQQNGRSHQQAPPPHTSHFCMLILIMSTQFL